MDQNACVQYGGHFSTIRVTIRDERNGSTYVKEALQLPRTRVHQPEGENRGHQRSHPGRTQTQKRTRKRSTKSLFLYGPGARPSTSRWAFCPHHQPSSAVFLGPKRSCVLISVCVPPLLPEDIQIKFNFKKTIASCRQYVIYLFNNLPQSDLQSHV